jgi:hypothetical protein
MMRYYAVPNEGNGVTPATARHPKYFISAAGMPLLTWTSRFYYGLEDLWVVAADLAAGDHTALVANSDVLAVPPTLTNTISANALNTLKIRLESINMPGQWLTTALTWREMLALVLRMMQFMQRFHGLFGRLFAGGLTLDTQINQIPINARNNLRDAAQAMGADTSSIVGTTLVREALVIVCNQLFPTGIPFGDTVF